MEPFYATSENSAVLKFTALQTLLVAHLGWYPVESTKWTAHFSMHWLDKAEQQRLRSAPVDQLSSSIQSALIEIGSTLSGLL